MCSSGRIPAVGFSSRSGSIRQARNRHGNALSGTCVFIKQGVVGLQTLHEADEIHFQSCDVAEG